MIEEIITVFVKELGTTGILLVGLYFILMKVGGLVAKNIRTINHNTTSMAKSVDKMASKYCGE